jgi:hypothetical protein
MTAAADAKLRLIAFGIGLLAVIAALTVSFVVTPEDIESGRVVLTPICPTKRFLGFECATCGMTRAFTALGHGRLGDALGYNRLSPLAWVLVWVAGVLAFRSALRAARDLRALAR